MSLKIGKKKWIIIVVAVVLVAIIGIGTIGGSAKKAQTVTPQGTVSYVEKRTIANSISGNGVVEAASKEDIIGGSYGMEVKSVHVEEGDVVAAGDIICVFDTTDQEERIADLQEQIIDREQDRLTQNVEYDQQITDSVESREEDLAEAKKKRKEAKEKMDAEEIILKEYESKRDEALAATGDPGDPTDPEVIKWQEKVNDQEEVYERARSRYETYDAEVKRLENQDSSNIVDSKENYNEQVTSSVESQLTQIEELVEQIEDATVRATMPGVVTSVNVSVGSNFTGGAVASVESLDAFIIEAQIEEYDIPDIAVGMKVMVKTDATRDQELEGVVTYVAPRATNSGSSSMGGFSSMLSGVDTSSFSSGSGSATYLVKITLNEQNERLRLGMNAKVSIITEEKVNTWSVPYDAVYTREDGTTYLEKVTGNDEDGNILTEELNVEMGLQGTYYVEVISSEITNDTQILIPDAQGNSSIQELLNMMGADAGI